MPKEPETEQLEKTITRLMHENAKWREKVTEIKTILVRRAPNTDGLTLNAAIKTVLNERDKAVDRIQFYRNELRSILQFLLNNENTDKQKINELRKRINQFLFKNRR